MNIIEAIKDEQLLRPFLADGDDSLKSWLNWLAAIRVVYGLPVPRSRREVVELCTGRSVESLPRDGFDTALFLTGRRSGKSRIAAVIGAYEGILAGHAQKLASGEKGVVAICAPTKRQGRIVKDYLRGIFETRLLRSEVIGETREGFELNNNSRIEILAGDFRSVRGYTLLAAIVDEACFFGLDDESKVRSDTELVRAIKPSLATVGGKLILISTPYAKAGWCYKTHQKNHGNDDGRILVWNCPSREMNPTLPQQVVDDALEDDMAMAKAEYLGEFRDDVGQFVSRETIESLVVKGRIELLPKKDINYEAFADLSGGRADDAALAIAHREGRKVVLDLLKRYRPPFQPYEVVRLMCEEVKKYRITRVVGDNYSAEFVATAFKSHGLQYVKCDKPKAILYAELLPRMTSGEIELLDNEVLVNQLARLERRTRSGGRDIIDHPSGGHDDLSNVLAGTADLAVATRIRVGGLW